MRKQRDAPAFQLAQQLVVTDEAVDAELDHVVRYRGLIELDHDAVCVMKIGFLRWMLERPV